MDQLITALLDLLFELRSQNIPLMIAGGFGLYLKRRHLESIGERTLLERLPSERATNDLDMFLRAEVLSNLDRTREVRDAILRLGYEPVEEAKFLHWKKTISIAGVPMETKIDFLVGPLGKYRERLKVSEPRARPKGDIKFHAHTVHEAIQLEDRPMTIEVSGFRTSGDHFAAEVDVPEAFPYVLMKLHAFADRKGDDNKDYGRHHALDVYTIIAMMTETEYERARSIAVQSSDDPHVMRAAEIVKNDFSSATAEGIIRLREHPLYRDDFQLQEVMDVLVEVFLARNAR